MSFLSTILRPPTSTLFPYTTLFRSGIDPQPLRKRIADITDPLAREDADAQDLMSGMARIKTGFDYGMGNIGYAATVNDVKEEASITTEAINVAICGV